MKRLDIIKDCDTCAHCLGIKNDRYTGDVDIGCALDECDIVLIDGDYIPSGWTERTYDDSEEECW